MLINDIILRMEIPINYLAIIAAAISNTILGFLWYGPLFGKAWIALMGFSPEKMEEMKKRGMGKIYIAAFLGALVMAYVLAHFVAFWGIEGVGGAWQIAFWTWLGFIATTMLGSVLWEGKSFKLYTLDVFYYLVSLFVMALILTFWQ